MAKSQGKNMSKLRIDYVSDEISPRDVRKLFAKFGEVGELSIHSEGFCTYVLAELLYPDAEAAEDHLDWRLWKGRRIKVRFANRVARGQWLAIHYWRPPEQERW